MIPSRRQNGSIPHWRCQSPVVDPRRPPFRFRIALSDINAVRIHLYVYDLCRRVATEASAFDRYELLLNWEKFMNKWGQNLSKVLIFGSSGQQFPVFWV